ncbi:hypothetical protein QP62_00195, partial [Staphylococcus aureus]
IELVGREGGAFLAIFGAHRDADIARRQLEQRAGDAGAGLFLVDDGDVGQVGVDIVDHRLGHRHQPERVDRDAARIGPLARIGIARIGQERIGEIVDQHAAALDLGDPDMALIVEGLPVQLVGQRALQPDDEAREFAGLIVGARAEV